jgi:hypothetical protein
MLDVSHGIPITPIFLDHLRAQWLLDSATERPSTEVVTSGLGFAFGLVLEACTDLRWAIAKDDGGTFVAMARTGVQPRLVCVPPFDFVSKREDLQNVEVFLHYFEQMPAAALGFKKPPNWLLDEIAP